MGVIDRAGTEEGPRPKYLTRSGEFKAVHAGQVVAANDVSPATEGSDAARARACSVRRSAMAARLAVLFRNALAADGIAQEDAAAALDRYRTEIADMCRRADEPRAKTMTGADVVLAAIRSESFFEGLVEMVRIMRGAK